LKHLIVTADDFGRSIAINEAVDEGHRKGILTSASLMVTAPQSADAIQRAQVLPELRVGLHVVVVDGEPCLPTGEVADLLGPDGRFSQQLVRSGFKFFFSARVRRQLAAEIRAQFEAFKRTGLVLDHVNAHHHMHLHPTVMDLMLNIGRDYGLESIRIPDEPPLAALCSSDAGLKCRHRQRRFLGPWLNRLRRRSAKFGVRHNDVLFGLYDSGTLSTEKLVRILAHVPDGVTELMMHPAKDASDTTSKKKISPGQEEFRALTHPRVTRSIERFGLTLTSFAELAANCG
jgi:hopanoid biosynthesis associated protein HpnK